MAKSGRAAAWVPHHLESHHVSITVVTARAQGTDLTSQQINTCVLQMSASTSLRDSPQNPAVSEGAKSGSGQGQNLSQTAAH